MASTEAAHRATRYHREHGERLRDTWPLRWSDGGRFVAAYVAMTAAFCGMGFLLTGPLDGSGVVRLDDRIERWFADRRTPGWNSVSWWGSHLSETGTKIVITTLVCIALLVVCKRWFEALLVAVPLLLEAACFLTITLIVRRPRPDVPHLDGSPVDTSFPSGHTAAAVCYAGIAIALAVRTRHRWLPALIGVLVAIVTAIVGVARMYRGMHHLTDVLAGALLGVTAVVVATYLLRRAEATFEVRSGRRPPSEGVGG